VIATPTCQETIRAITYSTPSHLAMSAQPWQWLVNVLPVCPSDVAKKSSVVPLGLSTMMSFSENLYTNFFVTSATAMRDLRFRCSSLRSLNLDGFSFVGNHSPPSKNKTRKGLNNGLHSVKYWRRKRIRRSSIYILFLRDWNRMRALLHTGFLRNLLLGFYHNDSKHLHW
jgi:hypothetical protein